MDLEVGVPSHQIIKQTQKKFPIGRLKKITGGFSGHLFFLILQS